MFKRLHSQYKALSPAKQLAISFMINWIVWFIFSLLREVVWDTDQPITFGSHIFYATWMAIFMTLLFRWSILKLIIKKKQIVKE